VIIFTRDKSSRLTETGQRELEGNAARREWGVTSGFFPTIHGTSFFGLLIVAAHTSFSSVQWRPFERKTFCFVARRKYRICGGAT
jgi:hypothetical protein